jgi:hypothetical protein
MISFARKQIRFVEQIRENAGGVFINTFACVNLVAVRVGEPSVVPVDVSGN